MIKFKNAKGFENKDIKLPIRKTTGSAGYDFYSNETIKISLSIVIPFIISNNTNISVLIHLYLLVFL